MRFLFTSVLLILAIGSQGQTKAQDRTFAALVVNDRDSSIVWYQEFFQMTLVDSTSIPESKLRMANLMNDDFHIELIELAGTIDLSKEERLPQGIFKFGKVVSDFDLVHNRLKEKGAKFRSEIFLDGKTQLRSFIILDPEGNHIQFFGK